MKRVLVGCGILIALGLVAVIVTSVVMYSWWESHAPDTEGLETARTALHETYGTPEEYHPPLDGTLDAARVETYLRVRESLVAPRDSIAVFVGEFLAEAARAERSDPGFVEGLRTGLSFAKQGVRLFADGVAFMKIRTEALHDAGMGEGEYDYLDALAVQSWLEWDPVLIVMDDPISEEGGDLVDGVEEAVERQRELVIDRLRDVRAAIDTLEAPSAAEADFGARVAEALEHVRGDRRAFPFEEEMPEAWAAILEPQRERLTATLPEDVSGILLELAGHMIEADGDGGVSFSYESN